MKRRKDWLYVFVAAAIVGMFASDLRAADTTVEFHGYLEANIVMRDENGAQYGFLDHFNAVQQRNTLKFDVDVHPGDLAWGDVRLDKFHLTYRGAYDSIFDLRGGHYSDISEKGGPTRFDYGLRDIRFENDLREATLDFVYNGSLGTGFFRPGRQLVSWGESSPGFTALDVINPADNSYQLFFQNPDDVKIPLWMGRINYSPPRMGPIALNFDLLWIPDIRPLQLGPLDRNAQSFGLLSTSVPGVVDEHTLMQAPYTSILPFGSLKGLAVQEDVPTEQQEYGAKVQAYLGERLSVSFVYFHDVINDPGLVLGQTSPLPFPIPFGPVNITNSPMRAFLTHDTRNVFGGYFSYQFQPLDVIIRGEYSHYTAAPINLPTSYVFPAALGLLPGGPDPQDVDAARNGVRTFRMKPVNKWMLAFDKNILVKWLAPHQNTMFSLEWDHVNVASWDSIFDAADSTVAKDQDQFQFTAIMTWFEGRVSPMFVAAYIPGRSGEGGGVGMIHPVITWTITPNLYTSLGMQAFFGDSKAIKTQFANFTGENKDVNQGGSPNGTAEVTWKIGYEW